MAAPTRLERGFTLVELLVAIALIAILMLWIFSRGCLTSTIVKGQLMACLNNAHQIHIAAEAMATDGVANKDSLLGWPGDLKENGHITTVEDFVNVLVRNEYLCRGDLKVFTAAGCKAYPCNSSSSSDRNRTLVPPFAEEYNAYKVYLVKKNDPADTLFLASKNYTYNTPLNDPNAKPFGDKGFVVFRKDGSGSILKKAQAQNLPLVGKLTGGGTVESGENCLNPGPPAP